MVIKTLYYTEIEGELQELTISELHNLIENKLIFGNSYVWDSSVKEWVELNQINIFKKFNIDFPFSEKKFEKPTIDPLKEQRDYTVHQGLEKFEQEKLQDYIAVFQKQFDELLEKNLNLVNENIHLKVQMNQVRSDNEIFKAQTLTEVEKLKKDKALVDIKLEDSQSYIDELMRETKILREGNKDLNKETNNKLERYAKENNHLNEEINRKLSEIDHVKFNLTEKEQTIEDLLQEINILNDTIKTQTEFFQEYEGQIVQKIDAVKKSHEDEIQELLFRIEALNNENVKNLQDSQGDSEDKFSQIIEKKNATIHKLLNQNAQIKNKFRSESKVAQQTFNNFKKSLEIEKTKAEKLSSENEQLNIVILEEKKKAVELETLLKKQEIVEQKIINKAPTKRANVKPVKRKQEEVGKLFELNNNHIWEIKGEPWESEGKFSFLEIKELLLKKEIDDLTFIRKESQWWKKIKELPEFKIEYFKKEVDGELKVYVERESFRVPTDFQVQFNTINADFTGKCLNISNGGCFIEVTNFSLYDLKASDEIILKLQHNHFKDIEFHANIKDIVPDERGIGVQFLELNDQEKGLINFFVEQFLEELDQAA